jgi:hypothetical protein
MLKALSITLVLTGLFSCGRPSEQRTEAILASRLIANNKLASFNFCEVGPAGWDSILVLKPYCPPEEMQRFGINNYLNARMLTPSQAYNDFSCTLLFLKKKSCIGYSVVSRAVVDMTRLANNKDFNLALITRTACVKKLHRNEATGGVSMTE